MGTHNDTGLASMSPNASLSLKPINAFMMQCQTQNTLSSSLPNVGCESDTARATVRLAKDLSPRDDVMYNTVDLGCQIYPGRQHLVSYWVLGPKKAAWSPTQVVPPTPPDSPSLICWADQPQLVMTGIYSKCYGRSMVSIDPIHIILTMNPYD